MRRVTVRVEHLGCQTFRVSGTDYGQINATRLFFVPLAADTYVCSSSPRLYGSPTNDTLRWSPREAGVKRRERWPDCGSIETQTVPTPTSTPFVSRHELCECVSSSS